MGAPVVMFLLHTTKSPSPLNIRAFLICVLPLRDTTWYAEGARDVGLVGAPVVMFYILLEVKVR